MRKLACLEIETTCIEPGDFTAEAAFKNNSCNEKSSTASPRFVVRNVRVLYASDYNNSAAPALHQSSALCHDCFEEEDDVDPTAPFSLAASSSRTARVAFSSLSPLAGIPASS